MLSQSTSTALRKTAQIITLLAIVGLSIVLIKGAVMFSLLLLAKCMVNLMAYPAALATLSTAMTGLLQHQLVIALLLGPLLLGPYLFRKFAFVTGLTSEDHPYSAMQFVREIVEGIQAGFLSFCALFKRIGKKPTVTTNPAVQPIGKESKESEEPIALGSTPTSVTYQIDQIAQKTSLAETDFEKSKIAAKVDVTTSPTFCFHA